MRLLLYGPAGQEKPGLIDAGGTLRDLSGGVADIGPAEISPEGLARVAAIAPGSLPPVAGTPRLGVPLAGIRNIIGIGLNYADHARETKGEPPPEPILFMKHTGSLSGPFDPIPLPPGAQRLDWEAELAVVIGLAAHRVAEEQAERHVAGYMVVNDVSERDHQFKRQGQWVKGKSAPVSARSALSWSAATKSRPAKTGDPPVGRWRGDAGQLHRSDGLPVAVPGVLCHQFMRLMPGDVILTGTPAGWASAASAI
jgi:2-keto-4-pentenoate hydratase/2-oxohepta-3-ene-1,7-dioic acid hydratase in catechol pathway